MRPSIDFLNSEINKVITKARLRPGKTEPNAAREGETEVISKYIAPGRGHVSKIGDLSGVRNDRTVHVGRS